VAVGRTYLSPPLSSGGAFVVRAAAAVGWDGEIVPTQCRTRHSVGHADWRIMPNGLVFPEIHGELFVIGSA
jgi:hypothetical protein